MGDRSGAAGRVTANTAPPPSASRTSTVPPWESATARTIDSPRPLPDRGLAALAGEALEHPLAQVRRARRGRGRRPRARRSSPARRTETTTGVPGGVWRKAFSIRLSTRRCRSSAEPSTTGGSPASAGRSSVSVVARGQRLRPRGRRRARPRDEVDRARAAPGGRRRRGRAAAGRRPAGASGATSAAPSRRSRRPPRGRAGRRPAVELLLEQLEVGEDAGERRAQLVRGVGHELALALQRRLGLAAGGVELAQHVLQRVGQLRHLVLGLRAWGGRWRGRGCAPPRGRRWVRPAIGRIARRATAKPGQERQAGAAEHAEREEEVEAVEWCPGGCARGLAYCTNATAPSIGVRSRAEAAAAVQRAGEQRPGHHAEVADVADAALDGRAEVGRAGRLADHGRRRGSTTRIAAPPAAAARSVVSGSHARRGSPERSRCTRSCSWRSAAVARRSSLKLVLHAAAR